MPSRPCSRANRSDLARQQTVTLGATVVSLTIATLAGYSLSRFRSRAQQSAGSHCSCPNAAREPDRHSILHRLSTFGLINHRLRLVLANAAVACHSRRGS
jgi:hypothetical protein